MVLGSGPTCCVASEKSFNHAGPRFPSLYCGDSNEHLEIKIKSGHMKSPARCLACSKCSIHAGLSFLIAAQIDLSRNSVRFQGAPDRLI